MSFTRLAGLLTLQSLNRSPITGCVLGILAACVLSHLSHFGIETAITCGSKFAKIFAYYLILVLLVDTPARLRSFLHWLARLTLLMTILALLHYHKIINIAALEAIQQVDIDEKTGEVYVIPRLCSTGVFNDPNDLSMVLVLGIIISIYQIETRRGFLRLLSIAPLCLFPYALKLTFSRGGLINLAVSLFVLFRAKFGWKRAMVIFIVAVPPMLALFGGRQTRVDLTDSEDTSQGRIQLWAEGFALLRASPIFGIGMDEYVEHIGFVAHNSFVHTYVELGFFGGMLFTGAFYTALRDISRLGNQYTGAHNIDIEKLRPYILTIISSLCIGMLSISRPYQVPTYMVLGIAMAYIQIAETRSSITALKLDSRFITHLFAVGVVWLIILNIFVRLMVRWG